MSAATPGGGGLRAEDASAGVGQIDELTRDLRELSALVAGLQATLDRLATRARPEGVPLAHPARERTTVWLNGTSSTLARSDVGTLLSQLGRCSLAMCLRHGRAWAAGQEMRCLRRSVIQFRLLARLAQTPGRFVDPATLCAAAWPATFSGDEGTDDRADAAKVAVHICRLRARLRTARRTLQIESGTEGYALFAPCDCVVICAAEPAAPSGLDGSSWEGTEVGRAAS